MLENLRYPFKYNWFINEHVAVIGWAFDENGKRSDSSSFASSFSTVRSQQAFRNQLKQLNGHFAVVINHKDFKAAAVDCIRSFPITYTKQSNSFEIICDFDFQDRILNKDAIESFQNCWCVLGNKTLVEQVSQLQAGQYICVEQNSVEVDFYYHHFQPNKWEEKNDETATKVLDKVYARWIDSVKNEIVVVPLSGGYDSRLNIAMLHRHGHQNVVAYTYGSKTSHEVAIAEKVADKLNIPWHFIEYTPSVFGNFFTEKWKEYSSNNHFYSSLPHEQEFFALQYLKQKEVLPSSFVAMPGYCGDLLGGSVTAFSSNNYDSNGLFRFIAKRHFQGARLDDCFENYSFPSENIVDESSFYDAYQQWFVCNKVSKFIVNSVRVFEHFGGEWVMPLWDKELIEYWYKVPIEDRKQQSFYNHILFKNFFEPYQIDYYKPSSDDNYPSAIKEIVKDWMPESLTEGVMKFKKKIQPNDPNNLNTLNKLIKSKLKSPVSNNEFEINNTHAFYFLENLNK